jgi:membrane-bound lytic murein transglycosylase MltF
MRIRPVRHRHNRTFDRSGRFSVREAFALRLAWPFVFGKLSAFVIGTTLNSPNAFVSACESLAALTGQATLRAIKPIAELARCRWLHASGLHASGLKATIAKPQGRFGGQMTALVKACVVAIAAILLAPAGGAAQEVMPAISLPGVRDWNGDFDGILKRRTLRILVPYSKTLYFIDRGRQMGVAAEFGQALEIWLNRRHARSHLRMNVVFVPTPRDELLEALAKGRGDAVAGNLTITPERLKQVDFAAPWLRDAKEIVVTGPTSPALPVFTDLAGRTIRVRPSSSYAAHLAEINKRFARDGLKPIDVRPISEDLEDEDLLEMVASGLLPLAVVDEHKAESWKGVFPGLTLRPDLVVSSGGDIAWAIRKGSPLLKAELDAFFSEHQTGTSFGNTIRRRYFGQGRGAKNAADERELRRFRELVGLFEKHGQAVGFNPIMLAAQGYQESQLDQSRRSPRGAIGVMQLLPSTAAAAPIGLTGIDRDPSINIEAGARYMRHLRDRYVTDPQLSDRNRALMTLAAYNAGPGNLRRFRREAKAKGLNPDVWFNNVEQGAAQVVGRETVQYVSNIYKYFIAYELALERTREHAGAQAESR